jgi:mono/diheme cytochrome c family protein
VIRKLAAVLLLVAALLWWLTRPAGIDPRSLPSGPGDVANGELVFHAGGCSACHGKDLAGGLEMSTDFGLFRVPNISPHPDAGIGGWSLTDFADAILRGVSPDGRHYYPAFPYTSYTRMFPGDVVDLKAYLDTFSPVDHRVAGHELSFPWNIRRGIGLWKMRYLDPDPVIATDRDDTVVERGRYLVEALGHCGECHTPRDAFGGLDTSRWLAGAPNPEGEGRVPNITPGMDGLGSWSTRDIAYYLESGFTPDFDTVGGSMVEVQENIALLPASDREAIATYLKFIPPVPPRP